MIGGNAHIPLLVQLVGSIFAEAGNTAAMRSVYDPNASQEFQLNPDFAVVLGATIQSALMSQAPNKHKLEASAIAAAVGNKIDKPLVCVEDNTDQFVHSAADDLVARSILDTILLMDSLPTSYGVRTMGGVMVPVLCKGMAVPMCKSINVTTSW